LEEGDKIQSLLFSATIPDWVKKVSAKFLDPEFKVVDLVKHLKNKTATHVKHLSINCPYQNRTSILADISKKPSLFSFQNSKAFSSRFLTSTICCKIICCYWMFG
jgi:superfamily II DNA/RNA helicase